MTWRLGQTFDENQACLLEHLVLARRTIGRLTRSTRNWTKTRTATLISRCHSVNLPPQSHSWPLQEFSEWWESSDRQEGMLDQRLAAAIAMREAKRK